MCMKNEINKSIESRLELVQQTVWKIEEYTIKTLGLTEMHRSELNEIKFCLSLLNEKLDKIDAELRGLRTDETD